MVPIVRDIYRDFLKGYRGRRTMDIMNILIVSHYIKCNTPRAYTRLNYLWHRVLILLNRRMYNASDRMKSFSLFFVPKCFKYTEVRASYIQGDQRSFYNHISKCIYIHNQSARKIESLFTMKLQRTV